MNRIQKYLIISIITVLCGTTATISAQVNNRVTVNQTKYAQKGDSVYVELLIGLNGAEISTNRFVLLTPVIQHQEKAMELPAVMINGKKRHQAYRRLEAMNRVPEGIGTVINAGEKELQPYLYKSAVAYEPWMRDADFVIREDQCDCGGPIIQMSFDLIVGRMHNLNPLNLTVSFREPNPEPVKHRSETGKAYLEFVVNKYDLNPNFRNNQNELAKIGEMIQKAQSDRDITITGIIINGYASPEGPSRTNMILSEKRVASLKNYLRTTYGLDRNLFKVEGHGEDWKTLEELIDDSNVRYRTDALEIIRSTRDLDLRERRLRELDGGVPYMDMFEYYFPELRRTDYELQYTVIPFTVEEGKMKLQINPSLLSLNEMFLIAATYPTGSPDFQRVFEIAAATYPDSDIASFNAGANALSAKNLEVARLYLDMAKTHDPVYENNRGVLLAMQGDHLEAAKYFRKAAEAGNQEAVKNLAEVDKVNPWTEKELKQIESIGTSSTIRKPVEF